jgi:hypothetical protein
MSVRLKNIRELGYALCLAALLAAGLPLAHAEDAVSQKGMHGAMQKHGGHHGSVQKGQHGKDHASKKHGGHGKSHGKGHSGQHHRKGHGRPHLFGDHWKKTLTAEQKAQLDRLHVDFAKKKHALTSAIHARKVQLAIMAIADQPQQEAMDAQINDLIVGERQLMQAKYAYIAAQRRVLTPEQQVSFDMEVVHKADEGKAERSHGGGKQ